jgi:hypothetical protein
MGAATIIFRTIGGFIAAVANLMKATGRHQPLASSKIMELDLQNNQGNYIAPPPADPASLAELRDAAAVTVAAHKAGMAAARSSN